MTEELLVIVDGVLKDGKKCEGEVRVPDGVTEIANMAFYQNKNLTGLYLPDGVKKLGNYTVNGCPNLQYVRVPESVEKLGEGALIKKMETSAGFTHTVESKEYFPDIHCKEGSFVDLQIKAMKEKDGWKDSHSSEHIVNVVYE